MKRKVSLLFVLLLATVTHVIAEPVTGTSTDAQQESFTTGYTYSFETVGTTVNITFELLDDKDGVVAYLWNRTNVFAEMPMTVTGKTATISLTDQTPGATLTFACKFAFAGGMAVTKDFTYTVEGELGGGEETPEPLSQCSGDKGHFGNPTNYRMHYEIVYVGTDVVFTITPYNSARTLDFGELHIVSVGNYAMTQVDGGKSYTYTLSGRPAGEVLYFRFLYSDDEIGGNEMTSENLTTTDANIITYTVGDCAQEGGEETPETPTVEYDVNFALASNGATATSSSGNAALAINGNDGDRWESAQGNDAEWFQVDLGQLRIFNTVQIRWEGAYGSSFTIDYSSDNTTWTNFATITDQTLAGFPYEQLFDVEEAVTARYVRFKGSKRGTVYGYSFFEFRVINASTSVLTTLTATAAADIVKLGEQVGFTVVAKDQNGTAMDDISIDYTVAPADAGVVENGQYKPAKAGLATITAKSGDIAAEPISIFTYEGDNVALSPSIADSKVIAQSEAFTDAFYAVDGNMGSVWQGAKTDGTPGDEASRTYDSWFTLDLGAYYDVNLVTIQFEGACSQEYHLDFSADNNNWNLAYDYKGNAGVNGHTDMLYGDNLQNKTSVRYVRFYSTKAATQWGMKIFELKVFATPGSAPVDETKPRMVSASLVSNSFNSAVIAVEATDNVGIAEYKVKDEVNNFLGAFAAVDGNITVTGLTPSTTYNLVITVLDLVGNESEESQTVSVMTTSHYYEPNVAAPIPTIAVELVKAIYSDTYGATTLGFSDWGGGYAAADKNVEADNYKMLTTTGGSYLGLLFADVDAADMKYLHLDIWAEYDGTVDVYPIYQINGANGPEYFKQVPIKGQQWNSIELVLADDYATITDWSKVYQIKLAGTHANNLAVDNIYFSKEPEIVIEKKSLYLINAKDDSWNTTSIQAHIWEDGGSDYTNWPGITMTLVEGVTDPWGKPVYRIDNVPVNNNRIIFSFYNGVGRTQTINLIIDWTKPYFRLFETSGDWDCKRYASIDDIAYTIYFVNTDGWANVYAYMWNSETDNNGGWPGTYISTPLSSLSGDGKQVYQHSWEQTDAGTKGWYENIIFNDNNGNQTGNLNTRNNYFYIKDENIWRTNKGLRVRHGYEEDDSSFENTEYMTSLDGDAYAVYTDIVLDANVTRAFKLFTENDDWWSMNPGDDRTFRRDNTIVTMWDDNPNAHVETDIKGKYRFIYDPTTNELMIQYPEKPVLEKAEYVSNTTRGLVIEVAGNAAVTKYIVEGNAYVPTDGKIEVDITGYTPGKYTVTVYAADEYENRSETSVDIDFTLECEWNNVEIAHEGNLDRTDDLFARTTIQRTADNELYIWVSQNADKGGKKLTSINLEGAGRKFDPPARNNPAIGVGVIGDASLGAKETLFMVAPYDESMTSASLQIVWIDENNNRSWMKNAPIYTIDFTSLCEAQAPASSCIVSGKAGDGATTDHAFEPFTVGYDVNIIQMDPTLLYVKATIKDDDISNMGSVYCRFRNSETNIVTETQLTKLRDKVYAQYVIIPESMRDMEVVALDVKFEVNAGGIRVTNPFYYNIATNTCVDDESFIIYHHNDAVDGRKYYDKSLIVQPIQYKRKFRPGMWETLCVPFDVERITVYDDVDGQDYELYAQYNNAGTTNEGSFWLRTFDAKGENVAVKADDFQNNWQDIRATSDTKALPQKNVPYIMMVPDVDGYYDNKYIVFHGRAYQHIATEYVQPAAPADEYFAYSGNNTMMPQVLGHAYVLDAAGEYFDGAATVTLQPFECAVNATAKTVQRMPRLGLNRQVDVTTDTPRPTTADVSGEVYSLMGIYMGQYTNIDEQMALLQRLPQGLYVVRTNTEVTKIWVEE